MTSLTLSLLVWLLRGVTQPSFFRCAKFHCRKLKTPSSGHFHHHHTMFLADSKCSSNASSSSSGCGARLSDRSSTTTADVGCRAPQHGHTACVYVASCDALVVVGVVVVVVVVEEEAESSRLLSSRHALRQSMGVHVNLCK